MRYLRTQHDQPLLLMNLDETGVPLFNGDRCGNVMKKRTVGGGTNQNEELVQYATTAESRGQATHVAIICDDVSVQPHLPQVIIGAHSLLTVTDCRNLQESLSDNVYLLRLKSRWTDRVIMERLIRTVARIVREQCPHKVPVLLLDTAPSHLHPALPCLARRLGMHLVLIPARTTWLLQPCDVYLFRKYKHAFRDRWLQCKQETLDGRLSRGTYWSALCEHVSAFMNAHDWSPAFLQTGFAADAGGLSRSVRRLLQLTDSWSLPEAHEPAAMDLEALAPRNRRTERIAAWLPRLHQFRGVAAMALEVAAAARIDAPDPVADAASLPAPSICSRPSGPAAASPAAAMLPPVAGEPASSRLGAVRSAATGPLTRSRSRALGTPPTETQESDLPPLMATPTVAPAPTFADPAATGPISARTRSRSFAHSTAG
jgi:hypothetical protein